MSKYEKFIEIAKSNKKFQNSDGSLSFSKLYQHLGLPHDTIITYAKDDFFGIGIENINIIINVLECKYEDIFAVETIPNFDGSKEAIKEQEFGSKELESICALAASPDERNKNLVAAFMKKKHHRHCWIIYKDKNNQSKKVDALFVDMPSYPAKHVEVEYEVTGSMIWTNPPTPSDNSIELLELLKSSRGDIKFSKVRIILPSLNIIKCSYKSMKRSDFNRQFLVSVCSFKFNIIQEQNT